MNADPNSGLFARWTNPELRLGLGCGLPAGGGTLGPSYSYYVDKAIGNDSNDGKSPSRAWKTLKQIGSIQLPAGETRSVLIKAGVYNEADDYVERSDSTGGGEGGEGATLFLTFEEGVTMDGTAANIAAAISGFEFAAVTQWTAYIYGNGLAINNYNKTGNSPNGVGNRGEHVLHVFDVVVDGSDDGISSHGNAEIHVWRSRFKNCTKAAFAHVGSSRTFHHQCIFEGKAGAILGVGAVAEATAQGVFENCKFIPATNGQTLGIDGAEITRCRVGTLSISVTLTSGYNVGGTIEDSFVNAYIDGHQRVSMNRGYGRFSTRVRSGGDVRVGHSVVAGPASGQTAVIFSNFNPGSAAKLVFNNSIVETATAAAFMNIDATNAGYLVAAASEMHGNVLSGSAAFDADLISADSGNTVRAGSLQVDALIGAANTFDPDDYGYGPGSPAIGAATNGSNCGFAVGEVPPLEEAP